MLEFKLLSKTKLKEMLAEHNLWLKMRSGKLLAKEQAIAPAKKVYGGTSYIITYYDEHIQNFFTIHRIVTKEGKVVHEHVKDAYIDGIRYKAKSK